MCRFLVGDELGNIKSIEYGMDSTQDHFKASVQTLYRGASSSIQALAVAPGPISMVAAAFSNGVTSTFSTQDVDTLQETRQWMETRMSSPHRYIGIDISQAGVLSCTSNGALRLMPREQASQDVQGAPAQLAALPARLYAWKMSHNQETFAYGGDHVEVSLWSMEQAFLASSGGTDHSTKKRKRAALFPGELWRGKNVQSDEVGLHQPLRITSLVYLNPSPTLLAVGTGLGHVHRYDTRATRRPVSNWKVGKLTDVKTLETGMLDYELFVSDHHSNLSAIDLRNGRTLYNYKSLAGTVTSLAPSPSILASGALDRYVRFHSTLNSSAKEYPQPCVLDKVFIKTTPTAIVWNRAPPQKLPEVTDEDIWTTMKTTG